MSTEAPPSAAALVAQLRDLPALPAVVASLIATLDDDDARLDALARQIQSDQAIAGKTLRVANSPMFGLRGTVGSIPEAITVLGFRTVRSLVLACGVGSVFGSATQSRSVRPPFWSHAFETAAAARELAPAAVGADQAYLAGLLHDIGKLALVTLEPQLADQVAAYATRDGLRWWEAEQALGLPSHGEIGGLIAQRWNLPSALAEGIAHHHHPSAATPVACVVHIADMLSHASDLAANPQLPAPQFQTVAFDVTRPTAVMLKRAAQAIRRAREMGGVQP